MVGCAGAWADSATTPYLAYGSNCTWTNTACAVGTWSTAPVPPAGGIPVVGGLGCGQPGVVTPAPCFFDAVWPAQAPRRADGGFLRSTGSHDNSMPVVCSCLQVGQGGGCELHGRCARKTSTQPIRSVRRCPSTAHLCQPPQRNIQLHAQNLALLRSAAGPLRLASQPHSLA